MAEHVYIAQISDPHIKAGGKLSYRRVDTQAALIAAIHTLNHLVPRPHLLLISGDLVDFGRAEEYATLREVLDGLTMPFYLIPGNHDDRTHLRKCFPEHTYLTQHDEFLQWTVDDYPVRLIGLDSTVPGQAHGELCLRRLEWLDDRLNEQPNTPTLIMLHHHPFHSGIQHMDRQPLRNAKAFEAVLMGYHNIERVLCGHLHRSMQTRFANTLACSCPGVSHQVALQLDHDTPPAFVMEPPGYLLHRWSPEGDVMTHMGFVDGFAGPYPFYDENGLID
ncbi:MULTISPECIES: phosphodiesterase [Halomonadaceae]|uniref:phosphodiesterase n=1 Tax=Halomonadaceae TaxID=28256 RepID=UPI001598020D|nr:MULTISPECIES: phosphodiesterase [Halomonas]QJQ96133.1 phosphodiesterase [Halomonas sp. PA5]